jgi:subtilisin family serine protease
VSKPDEVCLLDSSDGRHDHMADIYDAMTNRFRRLAPIAPIAPGITGAGVTCAIIDTGLLSKHPDIRARLIEAVDFTGEGAEDQDGHGTKVALMLIRQSPGISLISVKALRNRRPSRVGDLLKALRWVQKDPRPRTVNLSAGIYRGSCDGHCSVCRAARRVAASGKILCVAAGNRPDMTACPAKASDEAGLLVVSAADPAGRLWSYASRATAHGIVAPLSGQEPAFWADADGNPV